MKKVYNKLVRDKIPDIIKEGGETPNIRYLNDEEYRSELERKLYEEYREVIAADGDERLWELADMLEVMTALARLEGAELSDIIERSKEKSFKRGAFDLKIFLESVNSKE